MREIPPIDGPMDEWFSHRSAKPSTAVRIRFGPQKTLLQALVEGFLIFYTQIYTHFCNTWVQIAILNATNIVNPDNTLYLHYRMIRIIFSLRREIKSSIKKVAIIGDLYFISN